MSSAATALRDVLAPAVFLSHGAPHMVLEPRTTGAFLTRLAQQLRRPRAIVCVSAHWDTDRPAVTGSARPETIHDFYGFPDALYRLRYAAPGEPALARDIVEVLTQAGLAARLDHHRGLDHGCWVPLMLMYPAADIPVVQLSVQSALGAKHHLVLGGALAPLRERGVLIVGSGGATHNLGAFRGQPIDSPVADWAAEFDAWLHDVVSRGDRRALTRWLEQAPHAAQNHPTVEHFMPLFVAMGAAPEAARGYVLHRGFSYGMLSMAAYGWGAVLDR